jgi:peptidoglycan/LPS O-acetylase OafA/YrhL
VAALAYVTNWWLIVQKSSYFGGGDRPPLLTHLWSLAVEEQFYLVWPLVLILFARLRAHRRPTVAILLVGVAASSVVAALLYSPWKDPSRVYYGTDTRALAPLLGAALAIWLRPWKKQARAGRARATVFDLAGLVALAGLGAPDRRPRRR